MRARSAEKVHERTRRLPRWRRGSALPERSGASESPMSEGKRRDDRSDRWGLPVPRGSLSSGRQTHRPKPLSLPDVPARERSTFRRVGRFSLARLRLRHWATSKLPLFTLSRANVLRALWFAADLPTRFESRCRRCHDRNARFSGPVRPHARNLARAQTRMGKTQREARSLSEKQHGRTEQSGLNPRGGVGAQR